VGAAIEFSLHDSVRPDNSRDVDAGACAQTEVHRRACEGLLLRSPPRPALEFASDAERIDPLIAGSLLRARAEHVPVVVFRTSAKNTNGPSHGKSDEVELTISVQIEDLGDIGP